MLGDLVMKGPVEENAEDLKKFEAFSISYWQSQGLVFKDGEIKGRNSATGEIDIHAQGTERWAEQKIAPDGEGYWYSPSNDPKFKDWKLYIEAAGIILHSKEIRQDWEDTAKSDD